MRSGLDANGDGRRVCPSLRMYATGATVSNLKGQLSARVSLLVQGGLCRGMSTSGLSSSRALREFYATAWRLNLEGGLIVR